VTQVQNFLDVVKPDATTGLALDWEEHYDSAGRRDKAAEMTLQQAKEFLKLIYEKTGQRPMLYSGNLLKEVLAKGGDPFLSQHRLWIAQYGPKAKLPKGFKTYWLHQYTDGVHGPQPRGAPGVTGNVDLNVFGGKDLAAEWAYQSAKPAADVIPERANTTIADLKGKSVIVDAGIALRRAGIITAGGAAAVGGGTEAVDPVPQAIPDAVTTAVTNAPVVAVPATPPVPTDALSIDHIKHLSDGAGTVADGIGHVSTIVSTGQTVIHVIAQNTWLLALAGGIGMAVLAHLLLGKALEDYVLGLLHLREK
jgi:hypothetical protein